MGTDEEAGAAIYVLAGSRPINNRFDSASHFSLRRDARTTTTQLEHITCEQYLNPVAPCRDFNHLF